MTDRDDAYMRMALSLARRGLGRVWPNPAVGAVIVREGKILGRGWTQPGGRPHAETAALQQCENARAATLYVTLEPCAHHGQTPPCCDAVIRAGIQRVVYAIDDPDPRVQGRGAARLREAGVRVTSGLLAAEARDANAGFLSRVERGRPFVQAKIATTADTRIATVSGHSQWITGAEARRRGHLFRAETDAIMVGIGTVLADDPELTVRLDGLRHRSPIRVVLDRNLRLPEAAKLVVSAKQVPVWVFTLSGDTGRIAILRRAGVRVCRISNDCSNDAKFAKAVMDRLGQDGITRVMVEAGQRLTTSLLHQQLVDELLWFRAPSLIGGDGVAAFNSLGVDTLPAQIRLQRQKAVKMGDDILETFRVQT